MYEIFTYGRFEVEPENEDSFVEAWSEFAAWISRRPGNRSVRLMRDIRNTGRLVSVGKWDDAEAVRAFKSAPEFKEQLDRIVKLAKDFEPTELVTLVKAAGGTSERLSPPAELEPIHVNLVRHSEHLRVPGDAAIRSETGKPTWWIRDGCISLLRVVRMWG